MYLNLNNDAKGSVLLEALLSVIILSVCVTMIIQSMFVSIRALDYSSDYTMALIFADNKMNYLRYQKSNKHEQIGLNKFDKKYNYLVETKKLGRFDTIDIVTMNLSWSSGKKVNRVLFQTYLLDKEG